MEISIFDYIKNASDETLIKLMELAQIERRKRETQKEEAKKKYYTFSGTWSWSCWAISEEDARRQFDDDAYPETLEIDYDHPEIEVDD